MARAIKDAVCRYKTLRGYEVKRKAGWDTHCLLYTSDAADDLLCVDLGGRRNIKKKNTQLQKAKTTCLIC